MFCGTHGGDNIIVRLPEAKRAELLQKGWGKFSPMPDRVMKEYLVVPKYIKSNSTELQKLLLESLDYAFELPKKVKKSKYL